MAKKGFLLFNDTCELIEDLSVEQCGQLFQAIVAYAIKGEEPTQLDQVTKIVFKSFKIGIDRNSEHYEKVCERRRNAGKKGAEARWKQPQEEEEKPKQMSAAEIHELCERNKK